MLAAHTDEMLDLEDKAVEASRLLKLLANDRRLLILCRLVATGEMTVTALANAVGLGQSALSQHLARMREEGLVAFRREGTTLFYRIEDPKAARLLGTLYDIYCRPPAAAE